MSNKIKLGHGAYGNVYLDTDGLARKEFSSDSKAKSMIREIVSSQYFYDCENVLTISEFNLNKAYHKTPYCHKTLKQVIKTSGELSTEDKIKLIESLIYGLAYMHERDITHGDLKPSNVLYDGSKFIIGDLGFVCPSRYSKVYRTARYYREPEPVYHTSHDMYSLGIIFIELFCNIRIRKRYTFLELCNKIAGFPNPTIYDIILNLINPDSEKRMCSADLYFILYSKTIPKVNLIKPKVKIDPKIKKLTELYMIRNKRVCQNAYKFLKLNDDFGEYCLLYICSCVFGGLLKISTIKKIFRKKEVEIYSEISNLLLNKDLCTILYS